MPTLYEEILPKIQAQHSVGGGALVFQLRKEVFDAIDQGADDGDSTLAEIRSDLRQALIGWNRPEDYSAQRQLFEIYAEATFYIAATHRSIQIEKVPRAIGKTPDFRTTRTPSTNFEVKALDIASPESAYSEIAEAGLETSIAAEEAARSQGVGISTQIVSPHGDKILWSDVIEQVMSKLDGNVKPGQYRASPTILVADLSRVSIHVDRPNLHQVTHIPAEDTFEDRADTVNGQLWTIANHLRATDFRWQDPDLRVHSTPLDRSGILMDHPYVQAIIFTQAPWSEFDKVLDWRDSIKLYGVWNGQSKGFPHDQVGAAEQVFKQICDAYV